MNLVEKMREMQWSYRTSWLNRFAHVLLIDGGMDSYLSTCSNIFCYNHTKCSRVNPYNFSAIRQTHIRGNFMHKEITHLEKFEKMLFLEPCNNGGNVVLIIPLL